MQIKSIKNGVAIKKKAYTYFVLRYYNKKEDIVHNKIQLLPENIDPFKNKILLIYLIILL
jgi:hypothetical protein